MKTPEQILDFILLRIGHMYLRPLMYGGTASGVDILLHAYHELWAEVGDMRPVFEKISRDVHAEQGCGSANFSTRYQLEHPEASEQDVTTYVVEQWNVISERACVPIPYETRQIQQQHGRIIA